MLIFLNGEINLFIISVIICLATILIPNLLSKIFIGNSGVSLVSIILSVLVIDFYNNGIIFFDEIILIFFLPIIDAARITIERIINGKSPFESDKNHFHHLLSKIINKNFIFLVYLLISMMPFMITKINMPTHYSLFLFILLYLFFLYFLKNKNLKI